MITYANAEELVKYSDLFDEATKVVRKEKGDDSILINSIETYIQYLDILKAKYPKFVRLPIDEDVFAIDANARTIDVSNTSFSKNGIGVVGDELAEIVYFRINRYFDVADLANGNKKIIIQWTNAAKEQGVSLAYAVDKDSDPDYLYFGWGLTSNITKNSGNITFNVRIYSTEYHNCYDEKGNLIAYSESKQYYIKNGDSYQKVDISKADYDASPANYYFTIMAYSLSTQNATVAIKAGQNFDVLNDDSLVIDDIDNIVDERIIGKNIANSPIIITQPVTEASADTPDTIKAVATAKDGANVYSMWYGPDADKLVHTFAKLTKNSDGQYETAITVDNVGEYYVVFLAVTEDVDRTDTEGNKVEYHTTSARATSNKCAVPAPIKVEIGELSSRAIIGKSVMTLSIVKQLGNITAKVMKYNAEKKEYEDTGKTAELKNQDDDYYFEYNPTEEGNYTLQVINTRNKESIESDLSNACRVTEAAKLGAITMKAFDKEDQDISSQIQDKSATLGYYQIKYSAGMKLQAAFDEVDSDNMYYQWYYANEEEPDDDTPIDNATLQAYKIENGPGAGESIFYCVRVINELNGDFAPEDPVGKDKPGNVSYTIRVLG